MNDWKKLSSEEKLLIVKSDIYAYLKNNPLYWIDQNYLQKENTFDENGKEKTLYRVTKKAMDNLYEVFKNRVEKRLNTLSLKDKVDRVKLNHQECNLLHLMEV